MIHPLTSFVLVLFILVASPLALALQHNPQCVQDARDPFDPKVSFHKGSFRGRCVDARSVRPVRILSEDSERMVVANFYDDGRFWKASIPKNQIDRVLFHIVPFESGVPFIQAAHTQFRFLFKEGAQIDLEPQTPVALSERKPRSSRDVIISSTYAAPEGVEYNAWQSRGGSYGIVTRLMTSYARGLEEIKKDKSIVRQFELLLSPTEKNELFLHAIQRASLEEYSKTYGLMKNNCTTIVFDMLDVVRPPPKGVKPVRGTWWNIRDEFIEPSIKGLRERGIIDERSEIAPMNDEMKFD